MTARNSLLLFRQGIAIIAYERILACKLVLIIKHLKKMDGRA